MDRWMWHIKRAGLPPTETEGAGDGVVGTSFDDDIARRSGFGRFVCFHDCFAG